MRNATVAVLAAGMLVAGCSPTNDEYVTPPRLERGLVVILPGVEGEGFNSYAIRSGLLRAGVGSALPIYSWGRPVPLAGPLINQMDFIGNRLAGRRIADMIGNYQDSHPDRPVYLVGHSGGGGVAVFAVEALADGRKVDGIVLLSASISKGYDLTKVLSRCRNGIVNFHSSKDVGLLGVGTTVFGNVDGVHGPSAGLNGFDSNPVGLVQVPWTEDMASVGHHGGHMDSAGARFVRAYVADYVQGSGWSSRGY